MGESSNYNPQGHKYMIGGAEVNFPYKAYPSQISMMDKIMRSITKKQNCLLESPTGSGKSLALLCSALAWQQKFKKQMSELTNMVDRQVQQSSTIIINPMPSTIADDSKEIGTNAVSLDNFRFLPKDNKRYRPGPISYLDDDEDDFRPSKVPRMSSPVTPTTNNSGCKVNAEHNVKIAENSFDELNQSIDQRCDIATSPKACCSSEETVIQKVPKIFFGTRTHKQITQIIRELRKTSYKNVKMSILSSRNISCVHPEVSRGENKTEACDNLIHDDRGPQCIYYRRFKEISHKHPKSLSEAWDIEDLIRLLKKERACPYYAARSLSANSDIIFCPYNYLVDPNVRAALDIVLNDCIVIMDEAHNLEDSAREAASYELKQSKLEEARRDLNVIGEKKQWNNSYHKLEKILAELQKWQVDCGKTLESSKLYESSNKVFSGTDMVAFLTLVGAGPENYSDIKVCLADIINEAEEDKEMNLKEMKLASSTIGFLKNFLTILDYIYKDNMMYMPDYRCVIQKKTSMSYNALIRTKVTTTELSINFWCLSPAVAFSDLKGKIRNIIVTSGTLSPMMSFQSELNLPFEIMLESNHVVSSSQLWVGSIGHGPKGLALNATYSNSETFVFQDEIGVLILEICSIIPYGVLCFLPSYAMLDKLTKRWQTTGLWDSLRSKKVIVCEPRGQNQNFENVLSEYYEAVEEGGHNDDFEVNGAVLFAVCRGKVSEGLDFSDNNARAVITIGIPFPNIKDFQVDLKKKYNDSLSVSRGLLSGNEWYKIQAFRALNQALGRCIRHRNDFGALIIVDERFQKQANNVSSLSKWIRKEIVHFNNFNEAMTSLKEFSEKTGLAARQTKEESDEILKLQKSDQQKLSP